MTPPPPPDRAPVSPVRRPFTVRWARWAVPSSAAALAVGLVLARRRRRPAPVCSDGDAAPAPAPPDGPEVAVTGRAARSAELARVASRLGRSYATTGARQVFAGAAAKERIR